MTFEELRASLDARKVADFVDGFQRGTGIHENDTSQEAFVATLLAIRQEAIDDTWWFRSQVRDGAECEIHYAMKVDRNELERRRAIVRDFVESSKWTKKQRAMVVDLLDLWLNP